MEKFKITAFFFGLVFIVVFVSAYYSNSQPDRILTHKGFSICKIIGFQASGARGSIGDIAYSFSYKGKTYNDCFGDYGCTYTPMYGKTFPIIFDTLDPTFSMPLIRPKDFKYANIPFPDSLKWVLNLCDN